MITIKKELKTDQKQDQIDLNDYQYVADRLAPGVEIVSIEPAPFSKGRLHFNATNFYVKLGKIMATIGVFHIKPIYYVNKWGARRPLGEILSYHGNKRMRLRDGWEDKADFGFITWLVKRQQLLGSGLMYPMSRVPLLLNVVTTVYPDPNPETTTVDGTLDSGIQGTWAAARDAATGTADDTSANSVFMMARDNFNIIRGVFLFDASSIADNATKNSAIFSLAADGFGPNNANSDSIRIGTSAPASNTSLAAGDYATANFGSTNFGSFALASWVNTADTYNDVTVTADGLTNISLTAVTKWATRSLRDIDNSAPTGINNCESRMADNTGTSSDPKLAVTWTGLVTTGKYAANIAMLRVG